MLFLLHLLTIITLAIYIRVTYFSKKEKTVLSLYLLAILCTLLIAKGVHMGREEVIACIDELNAIEGMNPKSYYQG